MPFRTSRLSVFYVFVKRDLDVQHCAESLIEASNIQERTESTVLVKYDVAYAHHASEQHPIYESDIFC